MKTVIFPKPIYPNLDSDIISKIKNILPKYGIMVRFLFDSGIAFDYTNDLKPIFGYCGDLSFVKSSNNFIVIISFTENFGKLDFKNSLDEIILSIPIFD